MSYYNDYADDLLEKMLGSRHPYFKPSTTNTVIHMAKVTIDEKKKEVTIVLPLNEHPEPSASGKTTPIADARNEKTDVVFQGKPIKVNCQVYFKNQ